MILKKEKKNKENKKYNLNKFLLVYFLTTLIAGIIIVIFIYQSLFFNRLKWQALDSFSKAGRYEYLYLPRIAFKALKSNFSSLEKINLEINFENTLVLENIRDKAIKDGSLPSSDLNTKVNFKLIFNNEKYSGKIRLKGDRDVHYINKEKSSYKIELKKDDYILGVSKFALQKPIIRNYIHEWILHEMAKDFDLIKIKYEFLELSINGEDKGLYVLEEGFGKDLIERNKRRNGPIFGLDEELSIKTDNPVFEIYNKKYWAKDENKVLVETSSQKLRQFFNGDAALEDVFDVKKWASYFAIVDMTSTYHGAQLQSVKLYYNPINGLFEPIPFDGHREKPNYHKNNLDYDDSIMVDILKNPSKEELKKFSWIKKIFYKKNGKLNRSFYNMYIENLDIISSKYYIEKFLDKNLKEIEKINSHIYSDLSFDHAATGNDVNIGLFYFLLSDFIRRSEIIREKLKIRKKIQITKKNNSQFLIKNHYENYGLLVADKIICNSNEKNIEFKINKFVNNFSDTTINLQSKEISNLECKEVIFIDKLKDNLILSKIDHVNSEQDYKNFRINELNSWDKYFIKKKNELFLTSDEINITNDVYIPKGFKVVIKPGQKILLTDNAFILSNSPWIIGGSQKRTIITGEENNLGGGIIIADTNGLSKIINTKISYLNGYDFNSKDEFLILGSINFYETNVEINNVNFENILSEDAINIVRSNFEINNSKYKNISSDAIDIDFSNGKIENVDFKNIENDAIDFSGSDVEIYNSNFENVNDKLISAGEESNIKITNVSAINSMAGIISKDGSKVFASNIFLDNIKIPFAAYQKKKQYTYGSLTVKNFKSKNFLIKFAKDNESKIILNNVTQLANKKNNKMISTLIQ
jgi:hypothetical protein